MVVELILTGLFVGVLTRGKLTRLTDVKIRYAWMLFVPIGLYLASLAANFSRALPEASPVFGVVHLVEFAALMALAVANRRIPGAKLMFVGLAINFVALAANGGMMPASLDAIAKVWGDEVAREAVTRSMVRHAFVNAGTHLTFLCDVIAAKWPFVLLPSVYSIGDIVTSVGCMGAIIGIMRTPLPSEKTAAQEA